MIENLQQRFSPGIVILSLAVAFVGSYLAISLVEQLRSTYIHHLNQNAWTRRKWFLLIGVSLGGIGIWAMHFVGMSGLVMTNKLTNETVTVTYNIGVSILSIIVVVITTSLGAFVGSYDPLFAKTKAEILEEFIKQSNTMTMVEIRRLKNWVIVRIMCTKDLRLLITGGAIAGTGVCIMHYIGMTAMEFPGHIKWNAGIVAASVLIAVFAATAAFWILYRVLSIFPSRESLRVVSAAIMMVAVCGMHYTGMVAASMIFTDSFPEQMVHSDSVAQRDVMIPLVISVAATAWVICMILFDDLRTIVHKYRHQMKKQTNQRQQQQQQVALSSVNSHNNSSIHSHPVVTNAKRFFPSMGTKWTPFSLDNTSQNSSSFDRDMNGGNSIHSVVKDSFVKRMYDLEDGGKLVENAELEDELDGDTGLASTIHVKPIPEHHSPMNASTKKSMKLSIMTSDPSITSQDGQQPLSPLSPQQQHVTLLPLNEADLRKLQQQDNIIPSEEPTMHLHGPPPLTITISAKVMMNNNNNICSNNNMNSNSGSTRPTSSHGGNIGTPVGVNSSSSARPKSSSTPSYRRPSMEIDEIS